MFIAVKFSATSENLMGAMFFLTKLMYDTKTYYDLYFIVRP
jgi:hypothetical protein